ncbi:MAG: hypothetical protein CMK74_00500 [Pseudomonadales bacterium]|nr:hypothetical protein [Pseudomonadales bacterium]|tara:strand:+ start:1616 stop:1816 length:201 start_codon:yes stop_codon:yes gene_type:complete
MSLFSKAAPTAWEIVREPLMSGAAWAVGFVAGTAVATRTAQALGLMDTADESKRLAPSPQNQPRVQ